MSIVAVSTPDVTKRFTAESCHGVYVQVLQIKGFDTYRVANVEQPPFRVELQGSRGSAIHDPRRGEPPAKLRAAAG
jgi:hypothetical protein